MPSYSLGKLHLVVVRLVDAAILICGKAARDMVDGTVTCVEAELHGAAGRRDMVDGTVTCGMAG